MANVFLAVTEGTQGVQFNKLVVLKRLRDHVAEDPEFVTMLLDEGRIAARLNHPNVVQTLEVGRDNAEIFLAMEYLDGQPLHRILTRGRETFSLAMHLAVLVDVLAGIHDAHELKDFDGTSLHVVHRDVSPHNVFVTYNGQVKVVDFGIAKAEGRASETRHDVVKGKVLYMAPEQARRLVVDRRADVFAVGIMLYEACIQGRMWQGKSEVDVIRALNNGTYSRSPRDVDPTVDVELDRICQRALAPSPDERYETAEEFSKDLEAFMRARAPRPSSRELGAWLAERFADKREVTRRVIETQLADLAKHDLQVAVLSELPVRPPTTVERQTASETSTNVLSTDERAAKPTGAAPGGRRTRRMTAPLASRPPRRINVVRVGLLAAVALSAVVVMGVAASRGPKPAGDRTEAAQEVTLTLRAVPEEASFSIDDGPAVHNPYTGHVKRDQRGHKVTASAPGFEARTQTVNFSEDVSVRFDLARSVERR
jgi:serine/threonine-protein kinase